ncbi:phosphate ABC transporter permease PstA [Allocoleopsis franciscana]|uniref:Phosphate transport system permease protein PstA n=1 Tax=Allocoleopsis franciscana PCC 7113 TaxID=1173027 RepID=K9WJH0_9CYAN|nr:phosphate ABC transporter permease PstA [Allocoleopsis franciscana]AFZ19961.1 phosphate ABC transporter membrane protein 2, PhoT family [Allocoleopsis franciscana PCC 7113]
MTTEQNILDESLEQEIHQPLSLARTAFSIGMTLLAFTLTAAALLPLFAILLELLRQGFPQLMKLQEVHLFGLPVPLPEVLVSLPAPEGIENRTNGFANAIVGTLMMVGIAFLFSVPFGVMTGIFLSEFSKGSAVANYIRFIIVILSSVPSIVVGVFAYGVIVLTTKGASAIAGGFALSVIMLPIVALSAEEALKLVPTSHRLASAALGGGRFQTTVRIVLTSALPGITTGVLLAVARAAGETAPLIFTARSTQFWPKLSLQGLLEPTPSLSVLIYNYASSPYKQQNQLAWTASIVLIGLVLLSSILSRQVTRKRLKIR